MHIPLILIHSFACLSGTQYGIAHLIINFSFLACSWECHSKAQIFNRCHFQSVYLLIQASDRNSSILSMSWSAGEEKTHHERDKESENLWNIKLLLELEMTARNVSGSLTYWSCHGDREQDRFFWVITRNSLIKVTEICKTLKEGCDSFKNLARVIQSQGWHKYENMRSMALAVWFVASGPVPKLQTSQSGCWQNWAVCRPG